MKAGFIDTVKYNILLSGLYRKTNTLSNTCKTRNLKPDGMSFFKLKTMTNSHQHCFNWFACDLNFLMSYLQIAQILCLILLLSDAFKKKGNKNSKGRPEKGPYFVFMLYCM